MSKDPGQQFEGASRHDEGVRLVVDHQTDIAVVALRFFSEQLASPETFAAFVVDDPEVGVVAGAAGHCNVHPPGPNDLTTSRGYLYNVSTEPAFRRRGLARACVIALLDWYRDETEVGQVELHATEEGDGLYRALGFATSSYPAQRLEIVRA